MDKYNSVLAILYLDHKGGHQPKAVKAQATQTILYFISFFKIILKTEKPFFLPAEKSSVL